jgi:hypothetical protein
MVFNLDSAPALSLASRRALRKRTCSAARAEAASSSAVSCVILSAVSIWFWCRRLLDMGGCKNQGLEK